MRIKLFSRIQDEDFLEDLARDKKEKINGVKWGYPAAGGILGGSLGALSGHALARKSKNPAIGAAIGAGIGIVGGGLAGYKLSKPEIEKLTKDLEKRTNTYKRASEKDKAYLREKLSKDILQENDKSKAHAQRQMALAQMLMAMR